MILAVLSDIHSNSWALEAVVQHARANFGENVRFCLLGDVIGYGSQPLEVIRQVRQLDEEKALYPSTQYERAAFVKGNHDCAWLWFEKYPDTTEKLDQLVKIETHGARWASMNRFVENLYGKHLKDGSFKLQKYAVEALALNMLTMRSDPDTMAWYHHFLVSTPSDKQTMNGHSLDGWSLHLAHGNIINPLAGDLRACPEQNVKDYITYTLSPSFTSRSIFLHGHTHIPMSFSKTSRGAIDIIYGQKTRLDEEIHIINPGGVGLQRDHDIRPAYAVLELDAHEGWVTFFRVDLSEEIREKREQFLGLLKRDKYPEEVYQFFNAAPYSKNGSVSNDPECITFLNDIKKRAGNHWIAPGENHQ